MKTNKGFTLIEMMILFAIMGIMGIMVTVALSHHQESKKSQLPKQKTEQVIEKKEDTNETVKDI
jgi:type II secretory pathway pseudopilin PulG